MPPATRNTRLSAFTVRPSPETSIPKALLADGGMVPTRTRRTVDAFGYPDGGGTIRRPPEVVFWPVTRSSITNDPTATSMGSWDMVPLVGKVIALWVSDDRGEVGLLPCNLKIPLSP